MKDIATERSENIWEIKRNNKVSILTWNTERRLYGNPTHIFCRLCLIENLFITKFPNQYILLNKRSESISKCTYKFLFFLYF